MKSLLFILSLMSVTVCSIGQAKKTIDASASSVIFKVDNLGITVEGKARSISGSISFDENAIDQASFAIEIPVKSIRTGNKMRDEHLQEEEFFHASKFPTITFTSEKVIKVAQGYSLTGTLTMKGTSQTIAIPFTYANGQFNGSFNINRNDFNVGGDGFLNTISDEVAIQIACKVLK